MSPVAVQRPVVFPLGFRAAMLIAVLAGATRARAQATFTLGSSASDVRRVQGTPSVIERLGSLGLEIWTFGAATVRLSADSQRVIGWEDAGRALHVSLQSGPNATSALTFTAGSHADDVVRLMGTPTAIREDRARGTMTWRYGGSSVRISLADRRVVGFTDAGNLRVAGGESAHSDGDHRSTTPSPAPNAPATLGASLHFREPSGNGALDGGETATISIDVHNQGPGTAGGIRLGVTSDSGLRLDVGRLATLPRLESGATSRIDVPISAPIDVRDGHASVTVVVTEANGFGIATPLRLTIPVRAAKPPHLSLAGTRADDQNADGRIAVRELVDVTARVWNDGAGPARDVIATLSTGQDVFLVEETARRLTLGTMEPGDHRDVTFAMYTNTRARDVRVVIALTEATGRFGATLTVPFAIDRPIAQTLDVTVPEPTRTDSAPRVPTFLLDEVERDLPAARDPNPDAVAVVIGVERYATLPSARFAARDAQLFHRYAASVFGVPDDRNHLYVRTDADATGNEFRKLFSEEGWLARRVKPTTDLYVYFSGHGAPDIKARTPYLLPTDGDASYPRETGYALNQLYQQLARLNVRSITVFLDACFTGATRSSGTLFSGARPIVISIEQPALLRDNFAVIAASGGDQIASDYPSKRHGLFTYFALLGLRGAADADTDGAITVGELENYLRAQVPGVAGSLDREQTPVVIARNRSRVLVRLGTPR